MVQLGARVTRSASGRRLNTLHGPPGSAGKARQAIAQEIGAAVFVLRFVSTKCLQDGFMDSVDVFSVRDLRQRSGELLKEAEKGHVALITKHGRPAILAIPFDARLLDLGVHRAMALHLFEHGQVALAQAAKLAALSVEEFVELLSQAGIPAVDYPPEEIDDELSAAS